MKRKVLVTGAGGFIGHHLVNELVGNGCWVLAIDKKLPEFQQSLAGSFLQEDLLELPERFLSAKMTDLGIEEVYHLAADMGGIGYIGTQMYDIATNNITMDSKMLRAAIKAKVKKFFFSSSACIYPTHIQKMTRHVANGLKEFMAWPAHPEPGYGLEKLFMEELCQYAQNEGLIRTVVARFHNVYGPMGTYKGGREKAPAALCRKIANANTDNLAIEVWGDGTQRRSYTYIEDCIEGIVRLMALGKKITPVNLGSDVEVSTGELFELIAKISGKKVHPAYNLSAPIGVEYRNSNSQKIISLLEWKPSCDLEQGMKKTYDWIRQQIEKDEEAGKQ